MNNEVFQDKFMFLNLNFQVRFLPILRDESLMFRVEEFNKYRIIETRDVVFLTTNSLNVGDEYVITVPGLFELPTYDYEKRIVIRGFVDIDILGRKVEMRVNQLQQFSIKIVSKEELLEKIGEQANYSIQHTIQKYPSIVKKIK